MTNAHQQLECVDAESVDLERLAALFAIIQSAGISLLSLKTALEVDTRHRRTATRFELRQVVERLNLSLEASTAAIGTLEGLLARPALKRLMPKLPRTKRAKRTSNVIDLAEARMRRRHGVPS